jgi:hypothetical protein
MSCDANYASDELVRCGRSCTKAMPADGALTT